MNDRADWGFNRRADAVGNVVVDAEEGTGERTQLNPVVRVHFNALDVVDQAELFQTIANHADGQLSSKHRRRTQVFDQVRERTRMVEMAVSNNDAADLMLVLLGVCDVGQHIIDAGHAVGREHEADIYDDDILAIFNYHHVAAELAKSSERDDAQSVCRTAEAARRGRGRTFF